MIKKQPLQEKLKIKNDANDDLKKEIQKNQESEKEILSLKQRVSELQDQLKKLNQLELSQLEEFQEYVEQIGRIKELEDIEDNEQFEILMDQIIEMHNYNEKKLPATNFNCKMRN